MPDTVTKATRGASPVLLVLAALCFLLPFVGVSCNSSELQGLAGALPGGTGSGAQSSACLAAIANTDLYSYSGLNLATGSAPSTATVPPSCSTTVGGTSTSTGTPTVGVQPLLTVVLVLIIVGTLATILRSPMRYAVALGATFVAAILVIANNTVAHNAVRDKITELANQSSGSPNLGLQNIGGAGGLFNIHAAIGFILILVALFLAVAVNLAGLLVGSGLRVGHVPTGDSPPRAGTQAWPPEPPPGTAGAPPPSAGEPPPPPSG
jgi:hypothetical protein